MTRSHLVPVVHIHKITLHYPRQDLQVNRPSVFEKVTRGAQELHRNTVKCDLADGGRQTTAVLSFQKPGLQPNSRVFYQRQYL